MPGSRRTGPDVAKGFGIIFVVLGHVWRGCANAGLLDTGSDLYFRVDQAIYAFHMPLFFVVAGLFLTEGLRRRSVGATIRDRAARLLVPMAIWTYIFFLAQISAGSLANSPPSRVPLPVPGYLHLWFLWALFLCQISVTVLRPVLDPARRRRTLWIAFAVASAATFLPWPSSVLYWSSDMMAFLPFVVLGMLAGDGALRWRYGAVGPGLVFACVLLILPTILAAGVPAIAIAAVLSLSVLVVSDAVAARRWSWPLAALGTMSLSIYLMHTIFGAAVRILLIRFGIEGLAINVISGTLAGLLLPLAMLSLLDALRLRRILGLGGGRVTSTPARSPSASRGGRP